MYDDKVVEFRTTVGDFVGRVSRIKKRGKGWYRIHRPCTVEEFEDPANKIKTRRLIYLPGPQRNFVDYLDIYSPSSEPLVIIPANEEGALFKAYENEINRKPPSKIIIPDLGVSSGRN